MKICIYTNFGCEVFDGDVEISQFRKFDPMRDVIVMLGSNRVEVHHVSTKCFKKVETEFRHHHGIPHSQINENSASYLLIFVPSLSGSGVLDPFIQVTQLFCILELI